MITGGIRRFSRSSWVLHYVQLCSGLWGGELRKGFGLQSVLRFRAHLQHCTASGSGAHVIKRQDLRVWV